MFQKESVRASIVCLFLSCLFLFSVFLTPIVLPLSVQLLVEIPISLFRTQYVFATFDGSLSLSLSLDASLTHSILSTGRCCGSRCGWSGSVKEAPAHRGQTHGGTNLFRLEPSALAFFFLPFACEAFGSG
jgi:hypothetical protein